VIFKYKKNKRDSVFNYAQQIVFDIDEEEEDADVNALDGFE